MQDVTAVANTQSKETAAERARQAPAERERKRAAHADAASRLNEETKRLEGQDRERRDLLLREAEGADVTAEIRELDIVREATKRRVQGLTLLVTNRAAELEAANAEAEAAAAAAAREAEAARIADVRKRAVEAHATFFKAYREAATALGEFCSLCDEAGSFGGELASLAHPP
ncbi:MAG TPA: hypothetical protein VMU28_12720, partial [Terriglobales bacterium]|nr:hypothetical protein [Terriglobales bacterium]